MSVLLRALVFYEQGRLRSRAEEVIDGFARDPYCKLYLPLWKLDGDSFMSKDAYGHLCANHGSLWTPQGRKFDGVDDYVDCGSDESLNITDAITLEAWMNMSALTGAQEHIISKYQGGTELWELFFSVNSQIAIFWEKNLGYQNFASSVTLGEWAYLAVTFDYNAGKAKCYLNGNLDAEYNETLKIASNINSKVFIGKRDVGYGTFKGLMGLVLIYNRALTPQEITEHYIVGKELFG